MSSRTSHPLLGHFAGAVAALEALALDHEADEPAGRVIGIIGGTLARSGRCSRSGGAYPWWSLAIFALCVYVIHGIIV